MLLHRLYLKLLGPWLAPRWAWMGGFAAALAFYYLLSLIPFLIVTLSVLHRAFPGDFSPQIQSIFHSLLPNESSITPDLLLAAVEKTTQKGIFTINFCIALWTTWSFLMELRRSLHVIFSETPFVTPSGFKHALKSLGLVVVWSITLLCSALLFLAAPAIESTLSKLWVISSLALWIWNLWRFIVIAVLVFWAITLTYRLASENRWPLKQLRRGAFVATLGWLVICQGFTKLLPILWTQSPLNGALGSLMATLIWAYACAWSLLAGAILIVRNAPISEEAKT